MNLRQLTYLLKLRTKSQEAAGRSSELELKLVSLQELIVTLKDGKGAEKVGDCCSTFFVNVVFGAGPKLPHLNSTAAG